MLIYNNCCVYIPESFRKLGDLFMDAMLNGPQGRVLLGPAAVAIGRAQDNHLVLHDAKISAHHAEIRQEGRGHNIIDLESTNGTFLNEQRLEPNRPYQLKPMDTIL